MAVKAGEKRMTKGKAKDETAPKPKRGRPKKEPVAKQGQTRKQPVKAVAKKPHHQGPKVTEVIEKAIVQLAILGETSGNIAKEIKREFSIEISERTVRTHRLRRKTKINNQRKKEMERTLALHPLASLEGQIEVLDECVQKERRKRKRANKSIGYLVDIASRCVKNVRELALREAELELKQAKAQEGEDYGDKIIDFEEVKRKIVISRKEAEENEELAKLAGWRK